MEFSADKARSRKCQLVLACLMLGFAFSWVFMVPTAPVLAQDAPVQAPEKKEGDAPAEAKQNPIAHFFASIGIVFGVIFATVSVAIVALIIVLMMDLRMGEAVPPAFVEDFTNLVNKRQFKQAFEICRADNSFLARVMSAGMARLQYGIEDAREAMLSMLDTVRSSKEAWNTYLATIGTLGPLLGLVGTVSGMIGAFRELGGSTTPNAGALAREISHALVVTLAGVASAVPAIFFYSFFKNRLTKITQATSNLADDLLTQMYHNSKKSASAAPSATAVSASGGTS